MGLKRKQIVFFLISIVLLSISCTTKKSKSDIDIEFVQDTLNVGYTYWWPETGPFVGLCGEELSLVFSGSLINLENPTDDAGPLYKSQKGIVEINEVYKIKDLGENNYDNQKFIIADCFDGLHLNEGDQVLVTCYDFEDDYTIPGGKSILKLTGSEDPLIASIKDYIDSDQNALAIQNDIGLWAKAGLGRKLQEIISCQKETESSTSKNGAAVD